MSVEESKATVRRYIEEILNKLDYSHAEETRVIAVYTLKEGKIAKGEIFYDGLKMLQQRGFYPPMPEQE